MRQRPLVAGFFEQELMKISSQKLILIMFRNIIAANDNTRKKKGSLQSTEMNEMRIFRTRRSKHA